MPRVWLNVELGDGSEAQFTSNWHDVKSDDPTLGALELVDRLAEDARRWVRAQQRNVEVEGR